MARPRYRWRTRLRRHAPWFLVERGVLDKGSTDCGDHVFYNHDGSTERCYHCHVGTRPYEPAHCTAADSTTNNSTATDGKT